MDQMPLSIVEKVLKKYRNRWMDWFNWGEPLLHKDFLTIADMVKGTPSRVSTNLSHHMTDDQFSALNKFRVILVSLSGMSEEVYNIYNRGGNFNLVKDNLDRLVKSPHRTVIINWLSHKYNKQETDQCKDYCDKYSIRFCPVPLVCTVQEVVEGFDHELLQVPKFQKTGRRGCRIIHWLPIATDGSYLLCCASQNVKIGYTIDDDVTEEQLVKAKLDTALCTTCRDKGYWRMWS